MRKDHICRCRTSGTTAVRADPVPGWTGTRPCCEASSGVVSGWTPEDSGLRHNSRKGRQLGGRTLSGPRPYFLIWPFDQWTGLRPSPEYSGGLVLPTKTSAVHSFIQPIGNPLFLFDWCLPSKYSLLFPSQEPVTGVVSSCFLVVFVVSP